MKTEWKWDGSKRMWYRFSSTCHNAELVQKMLYLGKVVTDPNFKVVTTGTKVVKVPTNKPWWKFWKPKTHTVQEQVTNTKDVQFRYYCTECSKSSTGRWEFRHEKS